MKVWPATVAAAAAAATANRFFASFQYLFPMFFIAIHVVASFNIDVSIVIVVVDSVVVAVVVLVLFEC